MLRPVFRVQGLPLSMGGFALLFQCLEVGFLQEVGSLLHSGSRDLGDYLGIGECLVFGGEEGLG